MNSTYIDMMAPNSKKNIPVRFKRRYTKGKPSISQ